MFLATYLLRLLSTKRVVSQPPFGENDFELKAYVLELVNDDQETLFGLLVSADYLDIKGLYERILLNFPQKKRKRCKELICGLSTNGCCFSVSEDSFVVSYSK
ncbi:hypothetical protein M9H77_22610 [Catharanthus roseus]|uniref:Uncharacterized protein n=1 Tax=Catharanthus roseus TaxID=4058 RepID=A0ACC0ATH8_CATRO|nr:hypothetical protein M9H77_22610 [Catharanthus roseus]